MKKMFLFSLLLTLVLICNAQPKIWSVSKDASQEADYSEIQAAIDEASPGDYIYVYPSVYNEGFTIGMPVIIVGPGYFLGDNPNTQAVKSPALIKGEVIVGTNTSGAIITGLTIEQPLTIQSTSNVMIKRNRLNSIAIKNATNITIKQNYVQGGEIQTDHKLVLQWVSATISIGDNTSNIKVYNNYIENNNYTWDVYNQGCHSSISSNALSSLHIKNNVLNGNLYLYNATLENNILTQGEQKLLEICSCNYNIACNSSFGNNNGNQENITMTTVFKTSDSKDGKYEIKSGSPAMGGGLDGTNCGMFGGSDPYVLSGIPDIPAIYFFEAPDGASAADGLPVHIKIKSRQ